MTRLSRAERNNLQQLRGSGLSLSRATLHTRRAKTTWAKTALLSGLTVMGLCAGAMAFDVMVPRPGAPQAEVFNEETFAASRDAIEAILASAVSAQTTPPPQVTRAARPSPLDLPRLETLPAAYEAEPEDALCTQDLIQISQAATIYFPSGGAQLTSSDVNRIEGLARAVSACPTVKVLIGGYSDATGNAADNTALSWQRADAVIEVIQAIGFDTDAYSAIGYGSRKTTSAEAGVANPNDRRVEFTIVERIDVAAQ